MKYKYIAYEKNIIVEDVIEANNIDEAIDKIKFELGYSNIIDVKEIFDIKEYLNNANKKLQEVVNKLKSINISFDGITKVDEKEINEFKNFLNKNNEEIDFEQFFKTPNNNQNTATYNSKEEQEDTKLNFDLIFNNEENQENAEHLVKHLKVVKSKNIKKKELLNFFEKMATLLKSDISIVKGLDIIKQNSKDKKIRYIISIMENDIKNGEQLSSSMSRFPNIFPQLYISLVSAGEKSGSLPYVFEDLSNFLKNQIKAERKIKTMSIYPILVVIVLSALLLGGAYFLYPKLNDLFKSFGVKIPWYTEMIFTIGRYIYIPYIIVLFYKSIRKIIKAKFYKVDKFITETIGSIAVKIPIIKQYTYAVALYYYTNTMSIMLKNNLSIITALDQARMSINNAYIRKKFNTVTSEVVKGKKLSQVYKEINVDPILPEMVSIGEESGKLANSFQIISDYFNTNLQTQIEILTEMFQPATIVLLGIVILPILFGTFVPLMEVTSGSYVK